MKGIYCYIDNKTGLIDYIGKDSNIDIKSRYYSHKAPSHYDIQQINRVIQNNQDRYKYKVLIKGNFTPKVLNWLEKKYIAKYNPRFNFTHGGDGIDSGKNHPNYRYDLDDDVLAKEYYDNELSLKKIAEKYNTTDTTVIYRLKKNSHQLKNKAEVRNTSGYFRVTKEKSKTCKQGFTWRYNYTDNGKRKSIVSVSIDVLKKKVLDKGLEWREL